MTEAGASGGEAPAGAGAETEATGETVGEAKWAALRELERRFPGLDKARVEFVVLSEGERGLLGVGFAPARVVARLAVAPPETPEPEEPEADSPAARALRDLLERVRDALGVTARVAVHERGGSLVGTFSGPDLGLVIGRRGQTIDAIQYLAVAAVSRAAGERTDVVVDAAGYRERRRLSLDALADRTAARVASTGVAVSLEPMTAAERKAVHLRLKDRADVVTASEGVEPARYVVVRPSE